MTIAVDRQVELFRDNFRVVRDEVSRIIVGNEDNIVGIMTCLLARGHVLLEGVPGLGKTKLVQTLADVLHLKFSRIQFTPDLMPADIIGTTIVRETDAGRKLLEFQPGPIFANLVLADEINRATPKTQSALLEAMQENSVSAGGADASAAAAVLRAGHHEPARDGRHLSAARGAARPLLLQAASSGFPSARRSCTRSSTAPPSSRSRRSERVLGQGQILEMRETARSVPVARPVQDYAIRLTLATHPESESATEMTKRFVRFGSSPRGTQALILGGKVNALLNDRLYVACEDIRAVAPQCAAPPPAAQLRRRGRAREHRCAFSKDILQRVAEPAPGQA